MFIAIVNIFSNNIYIILPKLFDVDRSQNKITMLSKQYNVSLLRIINNDE
jgi:hypothetical protein